MNAAFLGFPRCAASRKPSAVARSNIESAVGHTTPVGLYPDGRSECGAFDMAGNVWEWVNDWYDARYYEKSPAKNPKGPDSGIEKVIRGAGWQNETPTVRIFTRVDSDPTIRNESTGFRCAADAK